MVGNITQLNDFPLPEKSSKIYMFDVRSYTWVYTYEPSTNSTNTSTTTTSIPTQTSATTTITSPPEPNNQLTTMKVVIGTISGIFGTATLIAIGFFGYRCHQRRQRERLNIMRVHGNAL